MLILSISVSKKEENLKPYIGITGFMSPDEVERIMNVVRIDGNRNLMVGVLASSKTLHGFKNKYPGRYPSVRRIKDIFFQRPAMLNLIHYSTDAPETLAAQLGKLMQWGGNKVHGFQLNVAWPSVAEIREHKRRYPATTIVLQVGKHAMELVDSSPNACAERVAQYDGVVDYVLIDPSGGRGEPLSVVTARDYLSAIRNHGIKMGLVVAGGLCAATLSRIKPLIKEFPDLSIDAEGRLRTPDDHLDIEAAIAYWQSADRLFQP
ncbi:MAG: hypothetical protein V1763_00580 [Parcubacteria group bacterium]